MAKLVAVFAITLLVVAVTEAQCPLSSKVTNCSPKCIENAQCSSIGGICCPNICNVKSCVLPSQFGNNKDKYDGSKSGGAGTYCGNIKCSSFEKCELDRTTKRMKCVRS